jgi:putative membrane protein
MNKTKVLVISSLTAILAEILLIFIIYFNPYKLDPIYDPELQVWINALMNACSAICLGIAVYFIKSGERSKHIIMIHMALLFSALFLLNYIFYHMTVGHTVFQHPTLRVPYLILLACHLLVSIISLPFIFITYGLAITNHLQDHKRIALVTFLMWEFVSVSGVMIVLFLKFLNTGP